MKTRFKIENNGETSYSDWVEDDSTLVAGTPQPPAAVRMVSDLRVLYPTGVFSQEFDSTVEVSNEEKAKIHARWLSGNT